MKRFLFLLIGLFFGTGLGFMLATQMDAPTARHDHGTHAETSSYGQSVTAHEAHHDMPVDTGSWAARPLLEAQVVKDPVSGWNLHVLTENFVFAPASAGRASVPGEGHAHVYLDDEKIARVYGDWFHIAAAPYDGAQLRVSLNDNAHHPLHWDGQPIEVVLPLPSE